MNYSPDGFEALHQEAEEQGGALLPDACAPQDIEFTSPPYTKEHTEKKVTCHCNNVARFVVPYDPEPPKKGKKKSNRATFATSCAVCDAVGDWPRFRDVVIAADAE